MDFKSVKKKILTDLKVELSDQFDKNFERKAFFNRPWPNRKIGKKGSLLNVRGGGGLRGSIKATVTENGVRFTSSLPYAAIHNEGGTIKVTAKMKRFFWAKYYELSGKVKVNARTHTVSKTTQKYSAEAEFYKNMALMKVGSTITMPQRQFIGDAPEVRQAVKRVIDQNMKDVEITIKNLLKQKNP